VTDKRNVNMLTKEQKDKAQNMTEWHLLMEGEDNPQLIVQYLLDRITNAVGATNLDVIVYVGAMLEERRKGQL
jgi:hypothetical protein